MNKGCSFRLLGETWAVTGLADLFCRGAPPPPHPPASTADGRCSREATTSAEPPYRGADPNRDPDIVVRVTEDATYEYAYTDTDSPPVGRSPEGYELRAEAFKTLIAADLGSVDVLGRREALSSGVRAGVRLCAILRCVRSGDGGQGLALHASCVKIMNGVWQGKAYVFCGRAGAGKSTAARVANRALRADILADDLVLLRRLGSPGRWVTDSLPWEAARASRDVPAVGAHFLRRGPDFGEFSRAAPAPLGAVIRIDKGDIFECERCTGARAAAIVLAAPPDVLGTDANAAILSASRLAAEACVFRATLPPGPEPVVKLLQRVRDLSSG